MKELEFLTHSGNVKSFQIIGQIFYPNDIPVPPEDLLALVPNATTVGFASNTNIKTTDELGACFEHKIEVKDYDTLSEDFTAEFLQKQ
uniref:Carbamoylphosphate synthase domain protein n=1 Tax=Panagrolaimus davidi TaxID=227884 RepID=A0A914P1J7_9BILA